MRKRKNSNSPPRTKRILRSNSVQNCENRKRSTHNSMSPVNRGKKVAKNEIEEVTTAPKDGLLSSTITHSDIADESFQPKATESSISPVTEPGTNIQATTSTIESSESSSIVTTAIATPILSSVRPSRSSTNQSMPMIPVSTLLQPSTSRSSGTDTFDQICNTFGMQSGAGFSPLTQQDIQEMANKQFKRHMQRMAKMTIQRRKNMEELNSLIRPRVTPVEVTQTDAPTSSTATQPEGNKPITENILNTLNLFGLEADPNFTSQPVSSQLVITTTPPSKTPIIVASAKQPISTETNANSNISVNLIAPSRQTATKDKTTSSSKPTPKVLKRVIYPQVNKSLTMLDRVKNFTSSEKNQTEEEQKTGESQNKTLEQVPDVYEENPVENEDEANTDEDAELPVPFVAWILEKIFANAAECSKFIESENCWTKGKHLILAKGEKQEYRCAKVKKRGAQCTAGIFTLYNFEPNNPQVKLFRKNLVHNHENSTNQVFKLSEDLKQIITDLYDAGDKFKGILYQLRQMDLEIQPRDTQVQTVITEHRRKTFGNMKADIMDFVDFYQKNKAIPDDEDKAFVVNFQRSAVGARDKWIRMFVSTKRLLKMSLDAQCLHVDGTYKTNSQHFPLIVLGTSDKARHFHLVGLVLTKRETNEDYHFAFESMKKGMMAVSGRVIHAEALISDAAPAIFMGYQKSFDHETIRVMCWFHVTFNVKKYKFNSQINRKKVKDDLHNMHLIYDEKIFDEAAKLFVKKWIEDEEDFVQMFENSFIKQNKNWFYGVSHQTPIHNNHTESFNSSLKVHQTHWERKTLSEFKVRMLEIMSQRSKEYVMDKVHFVPEVPITPKVEKKGYDYSISTKKCIHKKVESEKDTVEINTEKDVEAEKEAEIYKFYALASGSKRKDITGEVVDDFLNTDWSGFENFDELIAASQEIHCVTIDTSSNDWKTAKCTCPAYAEEYICKHVMALMYRLNILKRPNNTEPEFLEANPKGGPKLKAKKGLSRD